MNKLPSFRIIPDSEENPTIIEENEVKCKMQVNCIFPTNFPRKIHVGVFESIAIVQGFIYSIQ